MQLKIKKPNRFILIIGLSLLLLGSLIIVHNSSQTINAPLLGLALATIIGGIFIVLALKLKRNPHYLFIGIVVFLYGFYFCIIFSNIFLPFFTFPKTWPLLSLAVSLALFASGFKHHKKLKFVYLVPSISFVALSGVLLLFSTGLIKLPLKKIILRWMPLLMVSAGVLMIIISIYNQGKKSRQ